MWRSSVRRYNPISERSKQQVHRGLWGMSNPIVFFIRFRPQGCDAIDIALKYKVGCIGWPIWRKEVPYQRGSIDKCIVDLRAPDEEWRLAKEKVDPSHRRQASQNRNIVKDAVRGSILLIPRPTRGVVFAGRVQSFELVNDPLWAQEYLDLRRTQDCPVDNESDHVGDVVQCWHVDHFRPIPFPAIPGWIRNSFFGRSSFARIKSPEAMGLDPYSLLNTLIDQPGKVVRSWTTDPLEIERRLVTDVGTSSFEHLCVALLQLEHPDEAWTHIGGSGDGGVDGIGADSHGNVTGLLQCKWSYGGEPVEFAEPWGISEKDIGKRILASLLHGANTSAPTNVTFWSRSYIAELVLKHANHLPAALSMRIGKPMRHEQHERVDELVNTEAQIAAMMTSLTARAK